MSEQNPVDESSHLEHSRFGRRTFIAGAVSGLAPVVAITRGHTRLFSSSAQQDQATPAATSVAGSPVASPAATVVAPTATAIPLPPTLPVATIGQLQVFDEQHPVYSGPPVSGGSLRMALAGAENANYNPAALRQDFQIAASYLDPLIWIDDVSMEPMPWLATEWSWNKARTRITYTLRNDVFWHDGSRLTAEDVAFSLTVYRDDADSAVANLFLNMDSASATDDLTVEVELSSPDGNWILNASSQLIFQAKQYRDFWEGQQEGNRSLNGFSWRKSPPVGTGPWKVTRRTDNQAKFERNATYWAGAPLFDDLTLNATASAEDRIGAWLGGDIHVLWPLAPGDIPKVQDSPGNLYASDSATAMFAAFNFANTNRVDPALLSDISLRRALSMAIDRDRYAQEVFAGFVFQQQAGTVSQPWAHNASVVNPARDAGGARDMLSAAGYLDTDGNGVLETPNGDSLTLRLIVQDSAKPELIAVCQSIVTDLQQIGVALQVDVLTADQFEQSWITDRDYDLIAYSYPLYPGFTDFDLYGTAWDIRINLQGWNPGGYSDGHVDQAIREILEADDQAAQTSALYDLQKAADDDLFGLWFGFPRDLVLVKPELSGFQPNKLSQTWNTRKLWHR